MPRAAARPSAIICLLRGVNVGGHNKIKMEKLRAICESLNLRSPQTYVQSGNVVFLAASKLAADKHLSALANKIESAIERELNFRPHVILRTPGALRALIKKNPFAKRKDIEPGKLLVSFLKSDPGTAGRAAAASINAAPEELHAIGSELFIYFPNGSGQSKLPWSRLDKFLGTPGTARNWNTVLKLLELADALESS
jgi:uncharacterized protein (DUF1697 family)